MRHEISEVDELGHSPILVESGFEWQFSLAYRIGVARFKWSVVDWASHFAFGTAVNKITAEIESLVTSFNGHSQKSLAIL